ncbi:MAG: dephospho-CoA kinase [Thermodesulfobacteriota bacterium]
MNNSRYGEKLIRGGAGSGRRKRTPRRLQLGVTGSIATGKSTVARMLEEMGAPMIDFDVLSREVMEPGKPAYRDIVSYFGGQVLSEDKTLDREKLKEIVFRDKEKRTKLESFTHPRMFEAYLKQVEKLSQGEKPVIIQVVGPLIIEAHLQTLFDLLLMVYAPEEVQLKRLMERDGIIKELAMNIIRSQMSVEEKKGYCDLIVDNSGSLEETRRQVKVIWRKLQKIQKERLEGQNKDNPDLNKAGNFISGSGR